MKIVFADKYTTDFGDVDMSPISRHGEYKGYDYTSDENVATQLGEAEILITNKFKVTQSNLHLMPNLKYLCVAATGYNNLDLEALQKRGILASNVRGYSTSGVAQHVFAMITNLHNKTQHYIDEVRKGRWHSSRDFCFYDHSIEELSEKKIGIIGFGTIGKAVAKIAHAYGMEVNAFTAYEIEEEYKFVNSVSLEALISGSDVISLHAPLSDKTKHMINADTLAKMKKNAILVNTGRGPLIDENALIDHLKNNPNFHAMLDVLSNEPPSDKNELFSLDNCHITPHIAWASKSSRQKLIDGLAENIAAYLKGMPINRIV